MEEEKLKLKWAQINQVLKWADAQVPLGRKGILRVLLTDERAAVLKRYVDLVVVDLTVDTESEALGQNWLLINTVKNNLIHVLPHKPRQRQWVAALVVITQWDFTKLI